MLKIGSYAYVAIHFLLWVASPSMAASFNCAKASTEIEKMICEDQNLSIADEKLAKIYSQLVNSSSKSEAKKLKEEQMNWLTQRNNQLLDECLDAECAVNVYKKRITELESKFPSKSMSLTQKDRILLPPHFNCARARSNVEKMICGDKLLSDADGRLGKTYMRLKGKLSSTEFSQLKKEQTAWLLERDIQLTRCKRKAEDYVNCGLQIYQARIDLLANKLNSIQSTTPTSSKNSSLVGNYEADNSLFLTVEPLSNDRIFIEVQGEEQSAGRWTCEFSDVATVENNVAVVYHEEAEYPITFTFKDNKVKVEGQNLNSFCGLGGTIEGEYTKRQFLAK